MIQIREPAVAVLFTRQVPGKGVSPQRVVGTAGDKAMFLSEFQTMILSAVLFLSPALADEADFAAERNALVKELQSYASRDVTLPGGALDEKVLKALGKVRRHEFVPEKQLAQAYKNHPLPIGYGQTISQPYIVALMTDLVETEPDHVILEVGTGSGYQAAVLAKLVDRVYSIEIIEPLANQVRERLQRLGYDNVETTLGDGYHGWEEHGPYDAIVVTAAASHVPPPLIQQLKPGGRMVIPVGGRFQIQSLLLIEKKADGDLITRQITAVRFVPLTGDH
jgi:protein-L-isoaspartate(D-aspartate) O-methyltransferase